MSAEDVIVRALTAAAKKAAATMQEFAFNDFSVVHLPPNEREHPWFHEDSGEPHVPAFGAVTDQYAVAYWDQYPGEVQVYENGFVQEPISVEQAEKLALALLAAVATARKLGAQQ